ncbi:MAG: hypothetical protein Q8N95_07580 [Desulfobacterales bacterium]|nr:hypothetical protein [Desulfobacterales bacterium]
MTEKKLTLGQAIDQIISALDSLEPGARKTALEAASSHLGINALVNAPQHTMPQVPIPPLQGTSAPNPLTIDIRTLKEQKQPKSARQMACVVAYYLRELAPESERSETVNAQDLTKYFKQAGFKLPKTIGQILPDAKVAGYFETASGKGAYALNAVGYNLVAHNLPSNKGD